MDTDRVCYCFGYTEEDIVNDVLRGNGRSSILERIMTQKRIGGCNCKVTHPQGR